MRWLFIILVLILIFGAFKSANARNDYLNDRGCERGSIELYSELRGTDVKYIYLDRDGNPKNNRKKNLRVLSGRKNRKKQ